jgi:choline kinase
MLSSLLCAAEWAQGAECLISYSDIVYPPQHVQKLMAASAPLALTYDTDWQRLWSLRQNGDPLSDAETFRAQNGRLLEIGAKPKSLAEVEGQYMGLLKFTSEGWQKVLQECTELGPQTDKTDMTSFLSRLLKNGEIIEAVPVDGAWCEVDTDRDLELYEQALASNDFSHDWR